MNSKTTAAEIVLKHWQFCFNEYGVDSDRCPVACYRKELIRLLTIMGRHDLVSDVLGKRQIHGQSPREPEENLTFDLHSCYSTDSRSLNSGDNMSVFNHRLPDITVGKLAVESLDNIDAERIDIEAGESRSQGQGQGDRSVRSAVEHNSPQISHSRQTPVDAASPINRLETDETPVKTLMSPNQGKTDDGKVITMTSAFPVQSDVTRASGDVVHKVTAVSNKTYLHGSTARPKPKISAKPAIHRKSSTTAASSQQNGVALATTSLPGIMDKNVNKLDTTPAKRPSTLNVSSAANNYVPSVVFDDTPSGGGKGDEEGSARAKRRVRMARLSIAKETEETFL